MKKIYVLLMFCCLCLGLTGCDKGEDNKSKEELSDFYTNADYIYVDYTHELLTFEMLLLTDEKVDEIEVSDIKGKNVSVKDFEITVADNSIELIKNYTYKGMYPSVWYFSLQPKTKVTNMSIDKMTLLVNGEEHEVAFRNKLKLTDGDGTNFSGQMLPGVIPMEFPGSMINGQLTPTYSFTALENVSIKNVHTNCDIVTEIKAMMINGVEIEDIEYPIMIEKGDTVEMNIGFSSETLSENNYIITDIYMEYDTESGTDCFKSIIMVSPIYPILEEDLNPLREYIDMIINE